jgi:hypothetical protein
VFADCEEEVSIELLYRNHQQTKESFDVLRRQQSRSTHCPNSSCNKELKLYSFISKCYLCPARSVFLDPLNNNCPSC